MRRDIQFLRGIAVLVVVFFHAGAGGFANGFLGVDVFFVISGFLITSIILRELANGRFSLRNFYLRRAKRLLPAIYCTLIVTSLTSYFFLTPEQWKHYLDQLFGAVSFTANMVLPFQVGYFQQAAEAKPLLHIWSLSLEEQYYLTLPFLLMLTPCRWRGVLLLTAFVVSLVVCVTLVTFPIDYWRTPEVDSAQWAFYLFPTRAWELLAGSLCALVMLRKPGLRVPLFAKVLALLVIGVIVGFPLDPVHPRGDALLIVLATATLLLGRDDWLPRHFALRAVERVGDWSYSLYLVHWPLFAFAYIGYLGDIPAAARAVLVLVAFVLGYLQYRYVEEPFRHGWQSESARAWGWLGAATAMVFLVPAPMIIAARAGGMVVPDDLLQKRQYTYGLSQACANRYGARESEPPCTSGERPRTAVWGDSYAMHLIPGLLDNPDVPSPLVQLTLSVCGPVLDIAPIRSDKSLEWSRHCLRHNRSAFATISAMDSVEYVFMSSSFDRYLREGGPGFLEGELERTRDVSFAITKLVETIRSLRRAGKTPLLVSPPPRAGFNVGECLERKARGLVVLGRSDCDLSRSAYERADHEIIAALGEVQRLSSVEIIWLSDFMCDDDRCAVEQGGSPIYVDEGHLSVFGSERSLREIGVAEVPPSKQG